MARRLAAWLAVGILAAFQAQPVSAADAKPCQLRAIARLDLKFGESGRPLISLPVAGQPRTFLVDTGGVFSALTKDAAQAMGLRPKVVAPQVVHGFGGYSINSGVAAQGFALGQIPLPNYTFMVLPEGHGSGEFDGLLGADLLSHLDVDFDFARMKLNLLVPSECGDGVVYWGNTYTSLPIKFDDSYVDEGGTRFEGRHIFIDAKLDGHNIKVMLDTGAARSTMVLTQAKNIMGWSGSPPELQKYPDAKNVYTYQFKSLTLGGITVSNPVVDIYDRGDSEVAPDADFILGMSTLRQLHIYIAYGAKTLYFSPKDGDPTPQAASAPQKPGGQ